MYHVYIYVYIYLYNITISHIVPLNWWLMGSEYIPNNVRAGYVWFFREKETDFTQNLMVNHGISLSKNGCCMVLAQFSDTMGMCHVLLLRWTSRKTPRYLWVLIHNQCLAVSGNGIYRVAKKSWVEELSGGILCSLCSDKAIFFDDSTVHWILTMMIEVLAADFIATTE